MSDVSVLMRGWKITQQIKTHIGFRFHLSVLKGLHSWTIVKPNLKTNGHNISNNADSNKLPHKLLKNKKYSTLTESRIYCVFLCVAQVHDTEIYILANKLFLHTTSGREEKKQRPINVSFKYIYIVRRKNKPIQIMLN